MTPIAVPADANVPATYAGVVVKASRNAAAAQAFLTWLAGPDGQAILACARSSCHRPDRRADPHRQRKRRPRRILSCSRLTTDPVRPGPRRRIRNDSSPARRPSRNPDPAPVRRDPGGRHRAARSPAPTGTTTPTASTAASSATSRCSSSSDKFESGTGWPSFYDLVEEGRVATHEDRRLRHAPDRGALRATAAPISATSSTTGRARPACATASTRPPSISNPVRPAGLRSRIPRH